MYCPKCGSKVEDGTVFCGKCGMAIVVEENSSPIQPPKNFISEETGKGKRKLGFPVFTALIVIIAIGVVVVFLKNNIKDNGYISFVKEGSPETCPDITYGQAFGDFFSNPKWEYFESAEGLDVVEFSGGCLYADAEVTIKIQFVLDMEEETFTVEYFDMNGVPQSKFMAMAILINVFESYGSPDAGHVIGENINGFGTEEKNGSGDNQTQEADNEAKSLNDTDTDYMEEDEYKEYKKGDGYAKQEGEYIRSIGPCSYINIWSADENGIEFAATIGCSGWSAYRDLRDCKAVWIDNTMAVYQRDGIEMKLHFNEDGTFSVEEDGIDYNKMLTFSGTYGRSNDIDLEYAGFVLPYSGSEFVLEKDLEGLGPIECKIARNEIYARHGRIFADEILQNYFESCAWYSGEIPADEFDISILNNYEQENVNLISAYEEKMGYR